MDPVSAVLGAAPKALEVATKLAGAWRAHHDAREAELADPFAAARVALTEQRAETALVWRQGWTVRVAEVDAPTAAFLHLAFGQAQPLAAALDVPGFDVERWLAPAVADGLLVRIDVTT